MGKIGEGILGQVYTSMTRSFKESTTPNLDAQVLLAQILDRPRAWILSHTEYRLSKEQLERLTQALAQIENGVPLPYVLGHWEFYNLDFQLSQEVLIPRPETELLVETAIRWLQKHPKYRNAADIGTGSGCIAVSLAVNVPDLFLTAVDISQAALSIAKTNAVKHNVIDRIAFIMGDLFSGQSTEFNLITANLPYIPTTTLTQLDVFKREPILALDGGSEGLEVISRFLKKAPDFLAPGGALMMEIESNQGESALQLAHTHFSQAEISVNLDLAGHDRLLLIQT